MRVIWALAALTVKEGIRNRIIPAVILFTLLLCGANMVITGMFGREMGKVAVDIGLSTASASGLMILFFLGIPLITKDLDKRTVYMVLSRPVARWEYIIGKYIGLCLLISLPVICLSMISALTVKLLMSANPDYIPSLFTWTPFITALFFSLLSLYILLSLSIFFTCATTSGFLALALTAISYFVGHNISTVKRLLSGSDPQTPFHMFISAVSWIFPDLSLFNFKTQAAYGLTIPIFHIIHAIVYGFSYCGILLLLSIWIFTRKELT